MCAFVLPKGNLVAPAVDEERPRSNNGRQYDRFWLGKNESATITFLNEIHEVVGRVLEFQVVPDGDYSKSLNYVDSSLWTGKKCPLSDISRKEKQVQGSWMYFHSIIDHRSYISQDGTEYVDTRKLLPMKTPGQTQLNSMLAMALGISIDELEELAKKPPKEPILRGMQWKVSRSGGRQAARTGDAWMYVGRLLEKELQAFPVNEPFDMEERLKPDMDELNYWAGVIKGSPNLSRSFVTKDSKVAEETGDDDAPFDADAEIPV